MYTKVNTIDGLGRAIKNYISDGYTEFNIREDDQEGWWSIVVQSAIPKKNDFDYFTPEMLFATKCAFQQADDFALGLGGMGPFLKAEVIRLINESLIRKNCSHLAG